MKRAWLDEHVPVRAANSVSTWKNGINSVSNWKHGNRLKFVPYETERFKSSFCYNSINGF